MWTNDDALDYGQTESTLYVMGFPHGWTEKGDTRTGVLSDMERDLTLTQKMTEFKRLRPVVGTNGKRFLTGARLSR